VKKVLFNNSRSVRFGVDSFAVPIIKPKTKNTIYTEQIQNLNGAKHTLSRAESVYNYGFVCSGRWRNYTFGGSTSGIFVSDESLDFVRITNYFFPKKMYVKNNRMFTINSGGTMVYHTVDLTGSWNKDTVMQGMLYIPNEFGKCVELSAYKNDLLLVCEKALAAIDKNLSIKYLTNDNEILLNHLSGGGEEQVWESAFFGLGYATDTQHLREVFIKTDTALSLFVISNKIEKIMKIKPGGGIQKIKTNLRGDMFKLRIVVPSSINYFTIENVSAVITYGTKN
jgi:hypothetical protein